MGTHAQQTYVDAAIPVGAVIPYAGSSAPAKWLMCYGQTVSRTTYASLFSVLSTTYNTGGEAGTDFRLPDMRGRVAAGKDDMGGSAANRLTSANSGITATGLGNAGGDERVHQHTHAFSGSAVTSGAGSAHGHTFTGSAVNSGAMSANASHGHTQVYNGAPSGGALTGDTFAYGTIVDRMWRNVSISSTNVDHSHSVTAAGTNSNESAHTHSVTAAGTNANFGSGSSQNVQPTIILNYIIRAE